MKGTHLQFRLQSFELFFRYVKIPIYYGTKPVNTRHHLLFRGNAFENETFGKGVEIAQPRLSEIQRREEQIVQIHSSHTNTASFHVQNGNYETARRKIARGNVRMKPIDVTFGKKHGFVYWKGRIESRVYDFFVVDSSFTVNSSYFVR